MQHTPHTFPTVHAHSLLESAVVTLETRQKERNRAKWEVVSQMGLPPGKLERSFRREGSSFKESTTWPYGSTYLAQVLNSVPWDCEEAILRSEFKFRLKRTYCVCIVPFLQEYPVVQIPQCLSPGAV